MASLSQEKNSRERWALTRRKMKVIVKREGEREITPVPVQFGSTDSNRMKGKAPSIAEFNMPDLVIGSAVGLKVGGEKE